MKYFPIQITMQGFSRENLFPLPISPCLVCWRDDVLSGSLLATCEKQEDKNLYFEVDGV